MADVIGRAVVHVSADTNESSFKRAGDEAADDFGTQFGRALRSHNQRITDDFGDRINRTISAIGKKSGDSFSENFNQTISKNITGKDIGDRLREDIEKRTLSSRLRVRFRTYFSRAGRDSGDGFARRFADTIGDGATTVAVSFSRALQGGIVDNPPTALALLGGIIAAAPGIGSTIGAALSAGIGAGIAGIGIAFAAQADKVKARWKRLGGDLKTLFSGLAEPLEGTLIAIADQIEDMFDELAPSFRRAFKSMAPVIEDFSKSLTDAIGNQGPAIETFTDAFNKQLEGLAKSGGLGDTIDALEELADSLEGDELANFVDGLDDVLAKLVEVIEGLEEFNDATNEIEEGNIGKGFKDLFEVGGLGEEVRKEFGIVKKTIQGEGDAPLAKFIRGWNKADETIATAMENAGDAIGRFVTSIPGRLGDLGGTIGGIFSRAWNRVSTVTGTAIGGIVGRIRRFGGNIGRIISRAWNAVVRTTRRLWNRVTETISNVFGSVRRTVSRGLNSVRNNVSNIWGRVRRITTDAWNRVRTSIGNAIGRVRNSVSNGLGRVRNAVSNAWDRVRSATSNAWDRVRNAVTNGVDRVVGVVRGLPGKVRSAIGNLGRTLYNAGASLIQGLIDGIKSKIDDVTSAVSGVASKVSRFFPGSPVKEGPLTSWNNGGAGVRLMEFLASGIDEGSPLVANATRNVAADVAGTIPNTARGTQVGAGGATSNSSNSSSVTVNQNYYGPTTGSERLREIEWTMRYAVNNGRAAG